MADQTSKIKVRKGNRALYNVLCLGLRVWRFAAGIRTTSVNRCGELPKGPSIVLCNHGSFIDFVYAGLLLRKSYPHFVIARLYFYHKWLGRLLHLLGGFPKSMFAMDVESTKNCLRVLKDGEVLVMMPEARLSTAGSFEDIQSGTFSFLKKAGVPVYTLCLRGDYLADPKWGTGLRRGSTVESELDILFTAEQLAELSPEQIKAAVEERLWYDDFQWLQTRPEVHYRCGRLAEGLENILTRCPVCGGRCTLTTKGREVFCEKCGKLTALDDRYGFDPGFPFTHPGQWYDWQREQLRGEIAGDPAFALRSDVELRLPSLDGRSLTRSAGRGVCTLDRSGLTYTGTKDGAPFTVQFPLKKIYRLLFGAGENFELYDGTEILYFRPEERRSAVDWYLVSLLLYDELYGAEN